MYSEMNAFLLYRFVFVFEKKREDLDQDRFEPQKHHWFLAGSKRLLVCLILKPLVSTNDFGQWQQINESNHRAKVHL